jgi:endonuclease III
LIVNGRLVDQARGIDVAANPRVVREPIRRYSDLDPNAASEHDAWRATALAELERRALHRSADERALVLNDLCAQLLAVTRALGDSYGTPGLGNKADPVDELVYIILSRRTREGAYQAAYDALKKRYPVWEELAGAPATEVEQAIRFSGLGHRKAQSLQQALGSLIAHFGRCTLEPTRGWDDARTLAFLCALPEVGLKRAACVMMCSLDRPAFPVDAHVGRVLERLGVFRVLGIELAAADHKLKQRLLWNAVPPALRYSLHVNLLVHGRSTCVPRRPRCDSCVIEGACDARRASNRTLANRDSE